MRLPGWPGPGSHPRPDSLAGKTHVSVRTHLAESRMSHTLMEEADTENTSPEWLQYLMETTLLGWPFRAAISCPVTRFHILQLRSKGKQGPPCHIPTPCRAAKAGGAVQACPEEALRVWGANTGSRLPLSTDGRVAPDGGPAGTAEVLGLQQSSTRAIHGPVSQLGQANLRGKTLGSAGLTGLAALPRPVTSPHPAGLPRLGELSRHAQRRHTAASCWH